MVTTYRVATTNAPEKTMPNNIEAEEAVLGALLIDPDAMMKAASILAPESFYLEKNAWIYAAVQNLYERHEPADYLTVISELERQGRLNDCGGAAYLAALQNAVPTALHVEHYARLVSKMAGLRQAIRYSTVVAGLAYDGKLDQAAWFSKAQAELLKLAPRGSASFVSSDDAMGDLVTKIYLRIDEPVEVAGIKTGYTDWDRKFGGLQAGLHLIEGRTSSGKTWLALGLSEGAAGNGARVAFISLEMTAEQVSLRRVSAASGLKVNALETGYIWETNSMGYQQQRKFNSSEVERVKQATRDCSERAVFVASEHFTTSGDVMAKLMRMKAEQGIDLAIVDYVQKFNDDANTTEMVYGKAAHNLKDCADTLGIPIVLLSQVNRTNNQRGSQYLEIGDARQGGQVEEAADSIYFISSPDYGKTHDPTYQRKWIAEIECGKDRLTGSAAGRMIELSIDPETNAVTNKK